MVSEITIKYLGDWIEEEKKKIVKSFETIKHYERIRESLKQGELK